MLTCLFRTGRNVVCHVYFKIGVANLLFQELTLCLFIVNVITYYVAF